MSVYLTNLDTRLINIGEHAENGFRLFRELGMPQSTYLTVPIYKACVGKVGKVAATGLSFLAADLVVHQALPQAVNCIFSQVLSPLVEDETKEYFGLNDACTLSYSYLGTLGWMVLAIPVMYAKYRRG